MNAMNMRLSSDSSFANFRTGNASGLIRGEPNGAVRFRLVALDEIRRQTRQLPGVGGVHRLFVIGDVAIEAGLCGGEAIVELSELLSGSVILVHAGQPELQELPLYVVARRRVCAVERHCRERAI